MSILEVNAFKALFAKFEDAARYINAHYNEYEKDDVRKNRVLTNFMNNYVVPMEKAWSELSEKEKNSILSR